jgi:hypothetical protein
MKLYVANVTKQNFTFTYRVPERSQPCAQLIPFGSQICLAPNGSNTDLTQQEIDAILEQYDKYGIEDANGLDQNKKDKRPFSGICYSIGKPVSEARLQKSTVKLEQGLDKLGRQIRQEAAVAAQQDIEKRIMKGDQMPKPFDVSVEEVIPSKGLDEDLTHISDGVRITRNLTNVLPVLDMRSKIR